MKIFLKIIEADPELCGCIIFGPKTAKLPKRRGFFLKKTINNTILMYLLACFIVQNVKKNC